MGKDEKPLVKGDEVVTKGGGAGKVERTRGDKVVVRLDRSKNITVEKREDVTRRQPGSR